MCADTTVVHDDSNEPFPDDQVVYEVNTYGADFTVDGLVKRFERGDIYRPKFQRQFVWTQAQASKFVESILLGLPIPSVFLYREEPSQKHLIVDGLQRLTTLHAFRTGIFPTNERAFKLRDVREAFLGKTFKTLEDVERRRFEDSVIHAFVIQQTAPKDDSSVVYHIFDRLNSQGTPLQPQEVRAAIFHGPFQDLLVELNKNENWREIFGPPHKRSKDQELILRFLALRAGWKGYEKPMAKFLNSYMEQHRHLGEKLEAKLIKDFVTTCATVVDALGSKPFRPKSGLNVAVFDAMMVAVASTPQASPKAIRSAYRALLKNTKFDDYINRATSDESSVRGRIKLAIEALGAAA